MSLLENNYLVIEQTSSFLTSEFTIADEHGRSIGFIKNEGGLGKRMLLGDREFVVLDTDRTAVLRFNDVVSFWGDRMEFTHGDGRPIGSLTRKLSLFRQRHRIDLVDGDVLEVKGSFMEFNFQIHGNGGNCATVRRLFKGVGAALLERESYAVEFNTGLPTLQRLATLGAVIAIDVSRAKDRSRN